MSKKLSTHLTTNASVPVPDNQNETTAGSRPAPAHDAGAETGAVREHRPRHGRRAPRGPPLRPPLHARGGRRKDKPITPAGCIQRGRGVGRHHVTAASRQWTDPARQSPHNDTLMWLGAALFPGLN